VSWTASADLIGPSRAEVFDGAWVYTGRRGPWASIQLYGRRHTTLQESQPYGEGKTAVQERVSGGKLEVARLGDLVLSDLSRLEEAQLLDGEYLVCTDGDRALSEVRADGIVVRGEALSAILTR
jgi:hypothetical protein